MIKPTLHRLSKHLLRLVTVVGAVALCILLVGCTERPAYRVCGELHLGLSREIAGCTVVGGERYGFAPDVVDTVARRSGRKLHITSGQTREELYEALMDGAIDIAVVPASERVNFHRFPSESFYTTNFVLLTPRWGRLATGTTSREAWSGKRVLVDCNLFGTPSYKALTEAGAVCNTDHIDGDEMAYQTLIGKAHAVVAERSEAELLKFLHRNLVEVATIDEPCPVIFIFANNRIKHHFTSALRNFAASKEYAYMVEIYFGETSIAERFTQLRYRPTRVVGGISVWDDLVRHISDREGVDWRLMSAMAYHESRFRNDQVSHRGAVGLMQVTRIAAEDLGASEGYDLADPTTNITLAARLLRRSSRALGFGSTPTTDDQVAIVVASYNCGITRTLEAQRLVEEAGGNGASWEEVAAMMRRMSDAEFVATSSCRVGRFREAAITIAYTNGVMERYNTYRQSIGIDDKQHPTKGQKSDSE